MAIEIVNYDPNIKYEVTGNLGTDNGRTYHVFKHEVFISPWHRIAKAILLLAILIFTFGIGVFFADAMIKSIQTSSIWHELKVDDQSIPLEKRREYTLIALKKDGFNLKLASKEFQNTEVVVEVAIKDDPLSFQFASEEIRRTNKRLALQAVENDAEATNYILGDLKKDEDIFLKAIEADVEKLKLADPSLLKVRDFIIKAMQINPRAFAYADRELIENDLDLNKLALKKDLTLLKYASSKVKTKDFFMSWLKIDGTLLYYAPFKVRDDEDCVRVAVHNTIEALPFASVRLLKTEEFMHELTMREPYDGDDDVKLLTGKQQALYVKRAISFHSLPTPEHFAQTSRRAANAFKRGTQSRYELSHAEKRLEEAQKYNRVAKIIERIKKGEWFSAEV